MNWVYLLGVCRQQKRFTSSQALSLNIQVRRDLLVSHGASWGILPQTPVVSLRSVLSQASPLDPSEL
jgi:hypothetical protein